MIKYTIVTSISLRFYMCPQIFSTIGPNTRKKISVSTVPLRKGHFCDFTSFVVMATLGSTTSLFFPASLFNLGFYNDTSNRFLHKVPSRFISMRLSVTPLNSSDIVLHGFSTLSNCLVHGRLQTSYPPRETIRLF